MREARRLFLGFEGYFSEQSVWHHASHFLALGLCEFEILTSWSRVLALLKDQGSGQRHLIHLIHLILSPRFTRLIHLICALNPLNRVASLASTPSAAPQASNAWRPWRLCPAQGRWEASLISKCVPMHHVGWSFKS